MAVPIWKDYFFTLPDAADVATFTLYADGLAIYSGRAYKRPGADAIEIRVNDICADWLSSVLPNLDQASFEALSLPARFTLRYSYETGGGSAVVGTLGPVTFLPDWSYDYDYDADRDGMAFPVNGRIAPGMWLTYTSPAADSVTATVHTSTGDSTVIIPIAISGDFDSDFNNDFSRSARSAAAGTAVVDPFAWEGVEYVTIGGVRYDVVEDCHPYALYYTNAYGGWDFLLMEGASSEADGLTRHTIDTDYDNRDIRNRGRRNYVNEIAKRWTLRTGWLSDEESSRMHHLLNSADVYLYDIAAGAMIPVVLTNTDTPYKTYKTDGMVQYTVEAQLAQERTRR